MHKKQPPTLIKDTLEQLYVLPQRIEELKKSAARAGALTALTRLKHGKQILTQKIWLTAAPA